VRRYGKPGIAAVLAKLSRMDLHVEGGQEMLRNEMARPPDLTTAYWLIENLEAGRSEMFTVRIDAEREALPVFSFPEEAEMFVKLGGLEERGWRTAESTAGELLLRLAEYRRAGVGLVALDPLPEMMGPMFDTTIALVTLSLHGFVERHAGGPFVTTLDAPNVTEWDVR
jgi:hypothetical protein